MDIDTIKLALSSSDSFNAKALKDASKKAKEAKVTEVREHERRGYEFRPKMTIAIVNGTPVILEGIPDDVRAETWFPMVVSMLLDMDFQPSEVAKATFIRSESKSFNELKESTTARKGKGKKKAA